MVEQLGQPFHADLQPVFAPLETPFDDLPMLVKEKQDRKNDLLASRGASRMVHVATRLQDSGRYISSRCVVFPTSFCSAEPSNAESLLYRAYILAPAASASP